MTSSLQKTGSVWQAACFIAATSIGVSYLTLPALTGIAGFLPALLMTLVVRLVTLAISLLYTEAVLSQPDGANLITITRALMGKSWTVVLGVMFFLYTITFLTIYAYLTENFLIEFFDTTFSFHLSPIYAALLSTVPFFFFVYLGTAKSCNANTVLLIGLIAAFGLTVFWGSDRVLNSRLLEQDWVYIFFSIPTLFGALGIMSIMPPLCTYLNRDPKKIKQSLWLGSIITVVVYIIWQWFIIGAVPAGTLWATYEEGISLENFNKIIDTFPKIKSFFNLTLFLSMVTSTIGFGLALTDFFEDGLKIPPQARRGFKHLLICSATVLIVILLSVTYGDKFPLILQRFIAPLAEILINGIIPVWMVAAIRYLYFIKAPPMLEGGRTSLIILGICLFFLIYFEGVMLIAS